MANIQLAYGPGFSVDLVHDTDQKTASRIVLDNAKGADTITFWATISGGRRQIVARPGETTEIVFAIPLAYDEVIASIGHGVLRDTGVQKFVAGT
jgi:hypothetical protein